MVDRRKEKKHIRIREIKISKSVTIKRVDILKAEIIITVSRSMLDTSKIAELVSSDHPCRLLGHQDDDPPYGNHHDFAKY